MPAARPSLALAFLAAALASCCLPAPAAACCCPGDACPTCSVGQAVFVDGAFILGAVFHGYCNIFGCHCDKCYPGWTCQNTAGRRLAASTGLSPDPAPPPGHDCEDLAGTLAAPLDEVALRLSLTFCEGAAYGAAGNPSVGPTFAAAALAALDSDGDGTVTCEEWKIAKRAAAPGSLPAGGHIGPVSHLPPPACKPSAKGKDEWAAMNTYLARLRAAGFKANATAAVDAVKAGVHAAPAEVKAVAAEALEEFKKARGR